MSIWNFVTGEGIHGGDEGPVDMVTCLTFVRNGIYVVLGTNTGGLHLWKPSVVSVHRTYAFNESIFSIEAIEHNIIKVTSTLDRSIWEVRIYSAYDQEMAYLRR